MSKKGKKYLESLAKVDRDKFYDVASAVDLTKQAAYAKFDETVDVAIKLGVDPRHADQMVRSSVVLPHGTGKVSRVLVFAKGEKAKEAQSAGADIVGDDELIAKVESGWLDFDIVVATPDLMAKVGKLGKLLGPRGLMPNPKIGTVTNDVTGIIKNIKSGMIEFKVDKTGIIHCIIGKKSFESAKLLDNLKTLMQAVVKAKPAASKGVYVRSLTLSTTMGPGVKIDTVDFLAQIQ